MESIYVVLVCARCKKTIIVLKDDVEDTMNKNKYLACTHCGSKRVFKENETNDLRECMSHNSYKRVHGAIRQVRQE